MEHRFEDDLDTPALGPRTSDRWTTFLHSRRQTPLDMPALGPRTSDSKIEAMLEAVIHSSTCLRWWQIDLYADAYASYPGHAYITADPAGVARSVCDGFIDDMAWIAALHNTTLRSDWRARLAWWLLRRPHRPTRRPGPAFVGRYVGPARPDR